MSLTVEDGKKLSKNKKREQGVVYGTNKKNMTDFHLLENIPLKCYDNETLGKVLSGIKKDIEIERERMAEKMAKVRSVLEHQEQEIIKLKEELKKYGMAY